MQGIEPWTFALLARRSNQLSYTAILENRIILYNIRIVNS